MVIDTDRRAYDLSATRRPFVEALLRREGIAQTSAPSHIPRLSRRQPGPLSFAQERLWFLHQLAPESALYNLDTAVGLPFVPDAGLLRRALNEIVRRHEALRTTFQLVDGAPVQVVAARLALPLQVVDRGVHGGADGAVRRLRGRATVSAAGAADSVPGLRRLAASLAAWSGARAPTRVLARSAGRSRRSGPAV